MLFRDPQLTEPDIAFLKRVFADANQSGSFVDRRPELNELASRVVSLYKEITDKALENENNSK